MINLFQSKVVSNDILGHYLHMVRLKRLPSEWRDTLWMRTPYGCEKKGHRHLMDAKNFFIYFSIFEIRISAYEWRQTHLSSNLAKNEFRNLTASAGFHSLHICWISALFLSRRSYCFLEL